MYYIKNGLSKRWHWLAFLFALFGAIAAFGIGNRVQSNSIADAADDFGVPPLATSVVLVVLVSLSLLGGIRSISAWASKLVPLMATLYVSAGLVVLLFNATEIPSALALIVTSAFTGNAATGGFADATLIMAIQFGVAQGSPMKQGSVAHPLLTLPPKPITRYGKGPLPCLAPLSTPSSCAR